jgi:hypothetical protein
MRSVILLLLTTAAAVQSASVQAQGAAPACFGDVMTIRISQIKPGGTVQGFLKAVEAHKSWYRANGITDNDIVAARVFVRDDKTGQPTKYSDTEILTLHLRPPATSRTPNRNDAAFQTFVKQYRDNSDLKTEYLACVPRLQH